MQGDHVLVCTIWYTRHKESFRSLLWEPFYGLDFSSAMPSYSLVFSFVNLLSQFQSLVPNKKIFIENPVQTISPRLSSLSYKCSPSLELFSFDCMHQIS